VETAEFEMVGIEETTSFAESPHRHPV